MSLRYLEGSVAVQSYGAYFAEYRRHPEQKMLGPAVSRVGHGHVGCCSLGRSS